MKKGHRFCESDLLRINSKVLTESSTTHKVLLSRHSKPFRLPTHQAYWCFLKGNLFQFPFVAYLSSSLKAETSDHCFSHFDVRCHYILQSFLLHAITNTPSRREIFYIIVTCNSRGWKPFLFRQLKQPISSSLFAINSACIAI